MFELMTEGPPIVAVIGPTLSAELTVVGQITPYYDVVQVIVLLYFTFSRQDCLLTESPEGKKKRKITFVRSQIR